uniref:Uncharacterized protein n=1 Tax=Siphoviridae sp. ctpoI7 TaxID=2825678 RepID=A0A8S5P9B5_9CAUD|nr:MAG TPA: hypothetical protein [Siphoviridae sp. ctpoI7]
MKTNKCSEHTFPIIRTGKHLKNSIKSTFCQSTFVLHRVQNVLYMLKNRRIRALNFLYIKIH